MYVFVRRRSHVLEFNWFVAQVFYSYDAELHFVHKNDKDQLAVIGVLYSIGEADPFIANVSTLSLSKFIDIIIEAV